MRLIDADKLAEYIAENEQAFVFAIKSKDLTMLEDIILDIPTAYDVNKVVEQLKERSKEFNSGLRLHGKPEDMLTDEAIEIVKAGGNS